MSEPIVLTHQGSTDAGVVHVWSDGRAYLCTEAGEETISVEQALRLLGDQKENEMARKKKQDAPETIEDKTERRETFERHLRVILTREQIAEFADRAAHMLEERDTKEGNFEALKKQAKAELEALESKHRELSGYVRDKARYQEVQCERVFDYSRGVVIEKRLDTEETLQERAMTLDERQLGLELDDGGDAAAE